MNNEIEWINKNNELGEDEIKYVEDILCIKFPEDYIRCIKNNDGAYPVPDTFNIENNEETLNNLLSLHKDKGNFLLQVYEIMVGGGAQGLSLFLGSGAAG